MGTVVELPNARGAYALWARESHSAMKKYKALAYAAALAVLACSTMACQRGYGCPTDLSAAAEAAAATLELGR